MMKKTNIRKDLWGVVVWFALGYGGVELGKWLFPGLASETVIAFFLGGFLVFMGLSVYGYILQKRGEILKKAAMEQFIKDQKADQEKQAQIDREIIEQLRNEHQLSGAEQDRRLRALETAIKHLRGR